MNKITPCQCNQCKVDNNNVARACVVHDYVQYCTRNPQFVGICEWQEELSGEECKVLSEAVAHGFVKRTEPVNPDAPCCEHNGKPHACKNMKHALVQALITACAVADNEGQLSPQEVQLINEHIKSLM